MHPMYSAIKSRRAHLSMDSAVDDAKGGEPTSAPPASAHPYPKSSPNSVDHSKLDGQSFKPTKNPAGDLAPDDLDGNNVDGLPKGKNNALHADFGLTADPSMQEDDDQLKIQSDVLSHEANNPEHKPINRSFHQDIAGHEQGDIGEDQEVEKKLTEGYEAAGLGKRPRTLGGHVAAALFKKRGK